MTIPLKAYLYGGAFLALLLAYAGWSAHERSVGRLAVLLAQRDSAHRVDSLAAVVQAHARDSVMAVAAQLAQAATVEVQKDRATKARADSAIRAAATERARAEALLADSLASFAAMRGEVQRLVDVGRADSVTHAQEQAQSAHTITSLRTALAASQTAVASGVDAYNALLKRTLDAEGQRDILKRQQSGITGQLVRGVAWAAGGALVYAVVKR